MQQKRAVEIRQNSAATLRLQLLKPDGNPVDLTGYGYADGYGSISEAPVTGSGIFVRFRDSALVNRTVTSVAAEVIDASTGLVSAEFPTVVTDTAGIYLTEVGVQNTAARLIFSNELYTYVTHSAWATGTRRGPPSIDDFRLSLRDSDPISNELINNHDYGLVEIAYAATRVVTFWNSKPPILAAANYSTFSFPDRELWLVGGHLFLFELIEEHYRRNFLAHRAGNVTTDDKNRHREYNTAWTNRFQRFTEQVTHQKVAINYAGAYGTMRSTYPY
jgi:hypothetical protein